MAGWVKLWRDILDHPVFEDPVTLKVFVWCLARAKIEPSNFRGDTLQPGQFSTGRNTAGADLSLHPSSVYRALQRLQDFGCIAVEANKVRTIVTICNWSTYQDQQEEERTSSEQDAIKLRTSTEQAANTMKESKNLRIQEDPPPPTPSQAGPADGWGEVGEELSKLGSGAADAVVRDARKAGWSIDGAMALMAHWQNHREAEGWGIGLLAHNLAKPPRPAAECLALVKSGKPVDVQGQYAAEQARQLRETDDARSRAAREAERLAQSRLERFGPELDAMTIEERQALVASKGQWFSQQAMVCGSDWRCKKLLRDALLWALERSQSETVA